MFSHYPNLNYIYVSRVLKWEIYLKAIEITSAIVFSKTIILEQLYTSHLDWIQLHSKNTIQLHLKPNNLKPVKFIAEAYIMVVHSGGIADVLKLCNQAIADTASTPHKTIVVFTQVDITLKNKQVVLHKNVYPVGQYYKFAEKIYTAAGFNSIQELESFKAKHVVVPLDKLYDDQFFRSSTKNT